MLFCEIVPRCERKPLKFIPILLTDRWSLQMQTAYDLLIGGIQWPPDGSQWPPLVMSRLTLPVKVVFLTTSKLNLPCGFCTRL